MFVFSRVMQLTPGVCGESFLVLISIFPRVCFSQLVNHVFYYRCLAGCRVFREKTRVGTTSSVVIYYIIFYCEQSTIKTMNKKIKRCRLQTGFRNKKQNKKRDVEICPHARTLTRPSPPFQNPTPRVGTDRRRRTHSTQCSHIHSVVHHFHPPC